MKDAWKEIRPKTIFKVVIDWPLSDMEKEVLTFLYQPLIGAVAFSLYLTLLSEINGQTSQSEELFHADLITLTDSSLPQLTAARRKLEGIGLVDTFMKTDETLGRVLIYRLNHPETVERFFKDEILSITLLNTVGKRKFDKLYERFKPKFLRLEGYENISAGFKDVYLFKEEQIAAETELISKIQHDFENPRPTAPLTVESETFDWTFFEEQIAKLGIKLPTDKEAFRKLVFTFHESLGIDELEMANFASKSFDYYLNQIDTNEMKRQINAAFYPKRKQTQSVPLYFKPELSDKDNQTYRYNSLKLAGFTEEEIKIVLESEKIPPEKYLEGVKRSKGGFPTDLEKYNVRYLIEQSDLPNSVINILLHFVCSVENKKSLRSEHLNEIANDWAEQKISSPEAAILYVKERSQKNKAKQEKQTKQRFSSAPIRVEKLPDWVDQPSNSEKLSKERQRALQQQLQDLLKEEGE